MTRPSAGVSPSSTSSSPVESMATRALRCTGTMACPIAASIPISDGRIRVPAATILAPAATSAPLTRICCRSSTLCVITTRSPRNSVSSMGTTALQPEGMGAPVMILTAHPGATWGRSLPPAGRKPVTSNVAGMGAQSSDLTAKPSIAELSYCGMSHGAAMSLLMILPRASSSGTVSSPRGFTWASMMPRASSKLGMVHLGAETPAPGGAFLWRQQCRSHKKKTPVPPAGAGGGERICHAACTTSSTDAAGAGA